MSSLLFGVTPVDPVSSIAAALALTLIALLASLIPAIRAARLDPVIAPARLREQGVQGVHGQIVLSRADILEEAGSKPKRRHAVQLPDGTRHLLSNAVVALS